MWRLRVAGSTAFLPCCRGSRAPAACTSSSSSSFDTCIVLLRLLHVRYLHHGHAVLHHAWDPSHVHARLHGTPGRRQHHATASSSSTSTWPRHAAGAQRGLAGFLMTLTLMTLTLMTLMTLMTAIRGLPL